ncbi:MAG: peptide ABC transporter ATP-binding protein [Haloferacaceae archaeon]
MTETPDARAPITVETDLELTIDGARADVRSTGDRLFVEFPSLSAAARGLRGVPRTRTGEAAALLTATGLTVEIRARGRTILAIGADAPAGPLSQWVGTAPAQVRAAGLAGAAGREIAAGIRAVRELLG